MFDYIGNWIFKQNVIVKIVCVLKLQMHAKSAGRKSTGRDSGVASAQAEATFGECE